MAQSNPYLNRSMISSVEQFVGRRKELRYVMSRVGSPTPQSVSIVGERRVGKSSLLWHIAQPQVQARFLEQPDQYVFLMVDFQSRQDLSEETFCRFFGEMLRENVGDRVEVPEISSTDDMLAAVQSLARADLKLICLFDEFETVARNPAFTARFFGFLRSLANLYPVAFVTSSRRDLPSLCHHHEIAESPFFNIFSQTRLGPMPADEVDELIAGPSAAAGLALQPHTEQLVRLGGHWPFFLQIACATAFDLAAESGDGEIDWPTVEQRFREETSGHFQYFWSHFTPAEQAGLAELARDREPDRAAAAALDPLVEDGFLRKEGETLQLFSPAFADFLKETVESEEQARSSERSGSHLRRLAYAAIGLSLVAAIALLTDRKGDDVAENRAAAPPPLATSAPETNYPSASGPYQLSALQVEDLFASFYKSYEQHGLGRVRITNDDTVAATGTLRFYLSNWQRRPTEQHLTLAAKSTREVALTALLDPTIVQAEETLPVQTKVVLTITGGDAEIALQQTQEVKAYGSGSLRWDSIARAAAFVTSTDRAVTSFARPLLMAFATEAQSLGDPGRNLVRAMVLFEALKEHGIRYIPDSNTPYARNSADKAAVDHISYPAELLQHKSGDCDDLTVLFCSLLESAGVATALVDYPGHIFLLFDSGVTQANAYALPLDDAMYLIRGGRLWIPLEITLLEQSFLEAWRAARDELSKLSQRERRRLVLNTEQAWEDYPPPGQSLGNELAPPDRQALAAAVRTGSEELKQLIEEHIDRAYLNRLVVEPDNKRLRLELIKVYLALSRHDTAIEMAESYLLQKVGDTAAIHNQLGVACFLKGEMTRAALNFERAADMHPEDKGLRENLELALARLGRSAPGDGSRSADLTGDEAEKGAADLVGVDSFYWLE